MVHREDSRLAVQNPVGFFFCCSLEGGNLVWREGWFCCASSGLGIFLVLYGFWLGGFSVFCFMSYFFKGTEVITNTARFWM